MTTQQLIVRDFHDVRIRQRPGDGYLDATAMCKANSKRLNDYIRLKTTLEYLEALSSDTRIPVSKIIQVNKGVKRGKTPQDQGTWVHPYGAIHLAIWCNPNFAVLVTRWTFELLTEGTVSLDFKKSNLEITKFAKAQATKLDERGVVGNVRQIALNDSIKAEFDCDILAMYNLISPTSEAGKVLLIPTDIAKLVGLKNAKLVNQKLIELGLQTKHRDKRLYYKLTTEGLKYGQYQDTGKLHKLSESSRIIRWHETVLTQF